MSPTYYLEKIMKRSARLSYHEGKTSDRSPWVSQGGSSKLKLSEMTSEHDRDQSYQVVENISENHGQWKQDLVLGLFYI